jgi:hypothetical protein
MSYMQELMYNATLALADEGTLRQRLAGVEFYLSPRIMGKFPDPPIVKNKILDILRRIANIEAISDQEARKVAHDIVDLFLEVSGGWQEK